MQNQVFVMIILQFSNFPFAFQTSPFSQLFQNVAQQLPDPDTQPTTSSAAAQRSGSGGALATRGNGPPPPNQDQQPSGSQAQQQQAEEEEEEDGDQPQGADDNETMVRLLHGVFVNIGLLSVRRVKQMP